MAEYTPNSHRYKAEQKEKEEREKVEKIVSGSVKRKKTTELDKIGKAIISEDARNVKNHIVMDVLVPAFKNALSDVVTDAINMILFGDTKRRGSSSSGSPRYVAYDSRFRDSSYNRQESRRTSNYNFDDVILDTRGDAEEVLDRMNELIDRYGLVRVADMYDLVGLQCNYTDNKYGWNSLRTAEIIRDRDGYRLKLPRVVPFD